MKGETIPSEIILKSKFWNKLLFLEVKAVLPPIEADIGSNWWFKSNASLIDLFVFRSRGEIEETTESFVRDVCGGKFSKKEGWLLIREKFGLVWKQKKIFY